MSKFRLLNKKEIDARKQQERRAEIEEGKKLANSVDLLRETRSDEEKKLEEFRVQALTAIQNDINAKTLEKDIVAEDIRRKRNEREELLRPLTEKWVEVNEKERQLDAVKEMLFSERAELKLAIAANIQRERENEKENARVGDAKLRAGELLADASKKEKKAHRLLEKSEKRASEIESYTQGILQNATQKEKDVTLLSGYVEKRRKENEALSKELFDERKRLKDAWATLERTANRVKNGKL